ncbi:MAG: hypothetical protein HFI16_07270 [Lachnospiraceae bacterium]|nr:hypothetical protein [Lachnospiraceae bacterium]
MNTNEKKLYRTVILFFLLASVPMVILSFFNVPSADDFTFGRRMQAYISENGYHMFGMIKCAVENMADYYMRWEGRYSESIIASFMPDIFGCYWLSAIVIYGLLTGGITFFFYTLAKGLAGKEKAWAGVCIALTVCLAAVQNVPYPVEAFYWFIGAMAYMFYHASYLWMCGVVILYFTSQDRRRDIVLLTLLALLSAFVAGGNNVTAFVSILTYSAFVVLSLVTRRKRGIIFPFLLSVGGFLISYLSPGTTVRGGGSEHYTPVVVTIIKCFRWTIRQYLLEWTTAKILLMLCFLTPFLLKILLEMVDRYHFRFRFPGIAALGGVCFLSAMSSPPFYILGEPGPGRLRNIIYVSYLVVTVLVYGYFLGWAAAMEENRKTAEKIADLYQRLPVKKSIAAGIVVMGLMCIGDAKRYGVSIEACKEIAQGQAAQYHREAAERKKMYQSAEEADLEVAPYSEKPYLLFFDDITDNPENWKNMAVSAFYGKQTVKLNAYDPDVEYD